MKMGGIAATVVRVGQVPHRRGPDPNGETGEAKSGGREKATTSREAGKQQAGRKPR